jgi:hypothetical protein
MIKSLFEMDISGWKNLLVQVFVRLLMIGIPLWFACRYDNPTIVFVAIMAMGAAMFPTLDRVDSWVPGPRVLSHMVLYGPYVLYLLGFGFMVVWAAPSLDVMVESGRVVGEVVKGAPAIWSDLMKELDEVVSPETKEKIVAFLKDWVGKNGGSAALFLLKFGKGLGSTLTMILLLALFLPLPMFMLHSMREQVVAETRGYVARMLDGEGGSLTKAAIDFWEAFVMFVGSILGAILRAMVFFVVIYFFMLWGFKWYYKVPLPVASHLTYAVLLGTIGALPIIGGIINWVTISYVGYAMFGPGWKMVKLFVAQAIVHKSETGIVTPWLMKNQIHISLFAMVVAYMVALGYYGANAYGFIASFLLPPAMLALFLVHDRWNQGVYATTATTTPTA